MADLQRRQELAAWDVVSAFPAVRKQWRAAEGELLKGAWLAHVLHLSSPHPSLSSLQLEDGISRREDQLPEEFQVLR